MLTLAGLCLNPSVAKADTLTGRIVDINGVGVANGDVDAFDIPNAFELNLTGDSTDANGFFNVTLPASLYRITLEGPIGSQLVPVEIDNLLVVGTIDLGTITLEPGFILSGRVIDQMGFPIPTVDLDANDPATGASINIPGGQTDSFGLFSILVPSDLELRFDPRNISPTYAPIEISLVLTSNTDLGDVVLEPGFLVSGTVLDSGGNAVVNADLDFEDALTGQQALTYSDNTDFGGNFSVIVAARTWDIQVCPAPLVPLVAAEFKDFVVGADLDLGIINLLDGVSLFGTVTDSVGTPVLGVDVDVNDSGTGVSIALCSDNTDFTGAYSVFVPLGTFDVRFTNATGLDIKTDVIVVGPTQVDGSLTPCPPASATVRNGTGVNPLVLSSVSLARIGKTWQADLDCSGHASAACVLFLFSAPHSGINTAIGQFLLSGTQIFALTKSHTGNIVSFSYPLPPSLAFCGRMGYLQGLILGSPGIQLTNALDLLVGS